MNGCTGLRSLDLPTRVGEVGEGFLFACSALDEIDASSWSNMMVLPRFFLTGCTSLTSCTLPPNALPSIAPRQL